MNMIDKIVIIFMGVCTISAILTLITYIFYEVFNVGFADFSMIFFMCSIMYAVIMGLCITISNAKPKVINGVKK